MFGLQLLLRCLKFELETWLIYYTVQAECDNLGIFKLQVCDWPHDRNVIVKCESFEHKLSKERSLDDPIQCLFLFLFCFLAVVFRILFCFAFNKNSR
jgi:hypothetical protein